MAKAAKREQASPQKHESAKQKLRVVTEAPEKLADFGEEVAETLTERKKQLAKFSKKEQDAHMAKVREIMNRTKTKEIMARINREADVRGAEKKMKDVKELAARDIRKIEHHGKKAAFAAEARAELDMEQTKNVLEHDAARELKVSLNELHNIERTFGSIKDKVEFSWDEFLRASSAPEKPKGFGDRVASLFKKPDSMRKKMWKKIMDAMNESSAGQTKAVTRARHKS